eukprot:363764-Chlamydomonas_euryale.AAC.20
MHAARTLPASSLKKSRKLDTVDSRMEPDTQIVFASSRCSCSSGVSSSISADARQPLSGVRTSWHMSDMKSLLASLDAFSRATVSARCAACACAAASCRCALMRACASRNSMRCAVAAIFCDANICRRYHSERYAMRPPTAHATKMCTSASFERIALRLVKCQAAARLAGAASVSVPIHQRILRNVDVQMRKYAAYT